MYIQALSLTHSHKQLCCASQSVTSAPPLLPSSQQCHPMPGAHGGILTESAAAACQSGMQSPPIKECRRFHSARWTNAGRAPLHSGLKSSSRNNSCSSSNLPLQHCIPLALTLMAGFAKQSKGRECWLVGRLVGQTVGLLVGWLSGAPLPVARPCPLLTLNPF